MPEIIASTPPLRAGGPLLGWLAGRPRWLLTVVLMACALAVGYLDYLTGDELSVDFLYFPIVFAACWVINLRTAVAISLVSSVLWLVDDYLVPHAPPPDFVKYWTTAIRFGVLVAFAATGARLRAALARERQLAHFDSLTGLANRGYLFELGQRELERCRRRGEPMALAFLDCDDFKSVNDRHGHAAGDQVLRAVGRLLAAATRATDVAARIGGDEFALLMPATEATAARQIAERLQVELREATGAIGRPVTFSVGVVWCSTAPQSLETMLMAADRLMYQAKRQGRNIVVCRELFEQDSDASSRDGRAGGESSLASLDEALGTLQGV
jgi:diguanylate cyclase (GGDEF)-like protein